MTQLMSNLEYLSKEIGPRPAGTEEEQQAALYITERFQKEAGFAASMEEFASSSNLEGGRAVLALVIIVATILAMIFPVLSIPAFILSAAAAIIYALEELDRPVISRVLSRGASQNVVAKYQPNFDEQAAAVGRPSRTRKIILVAHYDTGRVTPPLVERFEMMNVPWALVCVIAAIAATVFLLFRIFAASGGGMGLIVLNLLSVIAILVCALPVVKAILMRMAPYNEGANNNASGVAALIDIARRIARGSVSEADLAQAADDVTVHGEEAARRAGLIPEGVDLRYEAEQQIAPDPDLGVYDEEERLLAAKAAIAALTGRPVERHVYGSVADKLVNSRASATATEFVDPAENREELAPVASEQTQGSSNIADDAAEASEVNVPVAVAPAPTAEGFENAPSWFVAAQKNAKKAESDTAAPVAVQRSKYTEAIENAERERLEREEQARVAEQQRRIAELRAREEEAREAIASNAAQMGAKNKAAADAVAADAAQAEAAQVDASAAEASGEQGPNGTVAMSPVAASGMASLPAIDSPQEASGADAERPARTRISGLPAIESTPSEAPAQTNPSRSGLLRKLRTNVPSLSGLISPVSSASSGGSSRSSSAAKTPLTDAAEANRAAARNSAAASVPSVVSVPSPLEQGAHNVQTEEPVDYDMEVPIGSTAAAESSMAQFDVPRSRAGNLLGKLRGADDESMDSPQEWLDVDDDFDARSVGRERGSWESFRDDRYFDDDDSFDEFGSGDETGRGRRWQGGAYSRLQLGHVDTRSGEDTDADIAPESALPEDVIDRSLTGEIEQIYHFRNPQFNTEIWFVAMGSDGEGHDGARAFMEEHHDELRGSMIIEIESLGAGVLSVASEEGRIRRTTASSRIKRYTRDAIAATGIALDEVSLAGTDSISSTVQKSGYQTMHLFGAEDGRPALKGSADDILENVDEMLLDEHVNFVFELLKH